MLPNDDWFVKEQAILDNARRLLDDAAILLAHDRAKSAFALTVIALEEIGKLILRRWATMDTPLSEGKGSAHLRKQRAVASLLVGERAGVALLRLDRTPGAIQRVVEDTTAALFNSEESDWLLSVERGLVDKTKQRALYEDEWPLESLAGREFTVEDTSSLMLHCGRAVKCVDDIVTMTFARVVFESKPTKRG